MATGDITISVAIEGGVSKSIVLDSATRVLSRAVVAAETRHTEVDTDVKWQVVMVNRLGNSILSQANGQLQSEASWTPKTFTAAT
jgi:predicted patatin/cPLA2 family phospholipase